MNFIRSRARGWGGVGTLPLACICHPPDSRPLFCIFFFSFFFTECLLFLQLFTPSDPQLLLFLSKCSSEIMEVSSLIIYITTKRPDLKSSLRVSSQISSKHTYLVSSQWEFSPEQYGQSLF